jgi:hypothetical protein
VTGLTPLTYAVVPFALRVLDQRLAISRLPADAETPRWAQEATGLVALTRTPTELSIVCAEDAVPAGATEEGGWCALVVEGTLELSEVGVLAELASPLAAAEIPIFVLSTYETDYVLVPAEALQAAVGALERAGHSVAAANGA